MEDERLRRGDGLSVYMVYDTPSGAYYHYCSQLCNALVDRAGGLGVRLAAVFGERGRAGIAPEEKALLRAEVETEVLIPGAGGRLRRYLGFLLSLVGLRKRIRRSFSCIHVQTTTGLDSLDLVLSLLFRSTGLPVIRTVHEVTAAERSRPPTAIERWMGGLQLRMADALIVHDERTRSILLELPGMRDMPVAVVPHGNYLVFGTLRRPGESVRRPSAVPAVLFFGIKRNKGIEVFVDALRALQDEGFSVRPVIAGRVTPGDEALLESIGRLKDVELAPGYISNSDLWKVYEACDMVVFPYLRGTTSGAIHLAYAFRRPVIVSDLECFRDVVVDGETGLVVPRGDSRALADAIRRMCEDAAMRTRMGEEGYRVACSRRYAWDEIARRTGDVYRDVLPGGGRPE